MRFSLRIAIWSLRYGLSQLVLLGLVGVATIAVGCVALAVLASLAGRIALRPADRELEARLEKTSLPRVPRDTARSPTALSPTVERLETIVASVGIQLAPPEDPDRPRPTPQVRDVFAAVSDELLAICELDPPTAELTSYPRYQAWRRDHGPVLEEAIDTILTGEPPVWPHDPAHDTEGPSTNLAGQLWWHRVLVAEAAIAAGGGDVQAAGRSLEASWRLNQPLLSSLQLTAVRTAIEILELQMAALRRCRIPSGDWPARLAALDPRRDLLASFVQRVGYGQRGGETYRGQRQPILGLLTRPFDRLSMVYSRRAATTAISCLEASSVTGFDAGRCTAEVIESVPRWNTSVRAALATDWDWWGQAVHGTLAAELTAQVLSVRGLDRSDALTRLGDPEARRGSRIDGVAWNYDVDDHGVSISLDPDVFAPDSGFPLEETVALSPRPPGPA